MGVCVSVGLCMRIQKPAEGAGSSEAAQGLLVLGTRPVHPF